MVGGIKISLDLYRLVCVTDRTRRVVSDATFFCLHTSPKVIFSTSTKTYGYVLKGGNDASRDQLCYTSSRIQLDFISERTWSDGATNHLGLRLEPR